MADVSVDLDKVFSGPDQGILLPPNSVGLEADDGHKLCPILSAAGSKISPCKTISSGP